LAAKTKKETKKKKATYPFPLKQRRILLETYSISWRLLYFMHVIISYEKHEHWKNQKQRSAHTYIHAIRFYIIIIPKIINCHLLVPSKWDERGSLLKQPLIKANEWATIQNETTIKSSKTKRKVVHYGSEHSESNSQKQDTPRNSRLCMYQLINLLLKRLSARTN